MEGGGMSLLRDGVPLLGANGQKGPAEIPAKRAFTYRFCLWQAKRQGIPLRFPPEHPLRLFCPPK